MASLAGNEGAGRLCDGERDERAGHGVRGHHRGTAGCSAWRRRPDERGGVPPALGAHAPEGDRRLGELGTGRVGGDRSWPVDERTGEMRAATKGWRDSFRERRLARRASQAAGAEGGDEEAEAEGGWKDQLIARLLQLPPDGFERLAQRILREAGFVNVTVTGKSGDGGIDGAGTYRLSLVSFPVYFQCKRYKGTVTPGVVRDFRGAMAGRGEKGLLITTGSFTRDAQAEATRDGAPPVELIDGDRLCDLLKEFRLGVDVRERIAEDVTVNPGFFDEYQ